MHRRIPFGLWLFPLLLGLGVPFLLGLRENPAAHWQVFVHPAGPWYVGDVLSWEVRAPRESALLASTNVTLQIDPPNGPQWTAPVRPYGFAQAATAVFRWVWDTSAVLPGPHAFRVVVQNQEVYQGTFYLWPASRRPAWEDAVAWAETDIPCCRLFYFTHTETARDLPYLKDIAQNAWEALHSFFPNAAEEAPIVLVFTPRLFGHGGFTWGDIWVTYRDRSPVPGLTVQVTRHEMVHALAQRAWPNQAVPALLAEGLAVALTQGHYRAGEDLLARTHALMRLHRYIPLPRLAQNFYSHQHETAYIEAGAAVTLLIERFGWAAVQRFYAETAIHQGETDVQALNRGLQAHFGWNLERLDAELRQAAQARALSPAEEADVAVTLALFDTLRRYQRLLDPEAYYATAWFPRREPMAARGLVADAVRSPNTALHATVELLLQQAARAWQEGRLQDARLFLNETNRILDAVEGGEPIPWTELPQAATVRRWVAWARACGGDIQRFDEHPARAWVRFLASPEPTLALWHLPVPGENPMACPAPGDLAARQVLRPTPQR